MLTRYDFERRGIFDARAFLVEIASMLESKQPSFDIWVWIRDRFNLNFSGEKVDPVLSSEEYFMFYKEALVNELKLLARR